MVELIPQEPPSSLVRGRVVEDVTGAPLAGVVVRWVVDAGTCEGEPFELGSARSGEDGAVEIAPVDRPGMREALCRIAYGADGSSSLVVDAENGGTFEQQVERDGAAETVLRIAYGSEPGPEEWGALAGYLIANRMLRADQLSGQLSAPFADSPVAAWPPHLRAGALAAVARALDNPEALELTHLVELEALQDNDLFRALSRYRTLDQYLQFGGRVEEWLGGTYYSLPKGDLELYRDYLRGVWVTAARRMHTLKGAPIPSDSALETQLDLRFHQNFRTGDVAPGPAHAHLIPILRSVLTTPAERAGFGRPPASVPAQAALDDAEYVAALVALTGKSAAELRNRFRIRFDRLPGDEVSAVELNVEALLGLLADTYQSPEEPFNAPLRGVDPGRPLIFPPYVGRAPFFLQYEEWLDRQRRFFPENVYDIRRALTHFWKGYREVVAAQKTAPHPLLNANNDFIASQDDWQKSAAWLERMFAITDEIRAALAAADKQAYPEAHGRLDTAVDQLGDARKARAVAWARKDFVWWNESGVFVTSPPDRRVSLETRAARPVNNRQQLAEFEAYFDARPEPRVPQYAGGPQPGHYDWMESWLARARTLYVNELDYLEYVVVPYLRSTVLEALGDHAGSLRLLGRLTGYEIGVAETADAAGYRQGDITVANEPLFYGADPLPYTTGLPYDAESRTFGDGSLPYPTPPLAPFERRFFKLAQAEAMLSWADDLYRTDDPSSLRRARELYKGVVFLHGEDPGIAPDFPAAGLHPVGFPGSPILVAQRNPAVLSQLARARANLAQLDLGLNAYGYRDDLVPVLRYKPLKQAADLFAGSAKSAQADFLQYQTRFEQAQIEGWQTAAMVKKAVAGAGIAAEQIEIAKAGVVKAQEQVAIVKGQIAAKQKEIADSDDFFSQASDFFGGMKDSLSGLASGASAVMADSSAAGSVGGDQVASVLAKSTGGASAGKEAAAATIGSGAALTFGFAAFAYYGYTSMLSMESAAAKRSGDLKALQTVALPAAEGQVRLKERDVTIARHGQQIAAAELELARALDRFQRDRFLNVDLWNKLTAFAHRTMKRYVELGARAAWLAERALAFEQNRALDIIRLNYVPTVLRGLTGADRLLLDLAELEAHRLQGMRLTTPVKHTISLARDFPLEFGQLKKTGSCRFHTSEAGVRAAYRGTFAYRLRALTVAAQDANGPPPRGILRNIGASTVSPDDASPPKLLVRFPDALPLSEFRLHDDLFVYGLPGETLLQFEGSGLETDWELEFPATANPKGLRSLTDVLITCDMNASYSQTLAERLAAEPAAPVLRSLLVAASVWSPVGLASFRKTSGPARVDFDLRRLALPAQEANRQITNLAVLAVGKTDKTYSATVRATKPAVTQAAFQVVGGVALSNAGSLQGTKPALPLNALVGLPVDQTLTVTIQRAGVADELRALADLVLYVEYSADV